MDVLELSDAWLYFMMPSTGGRKRSRTFFCRTNESFVPLSMRTRSSYVTHQDERREPRNSTVLDQILRVTDPTV